MAPKIVVITGPTASGKTWLAVELAGIALLQFPPQGAFLVKGGEGAAGEE